MTKHNRPPCKHNYRAKPDATLRIVSGLVRVPLFLYPSHTMHSFDNIRAVATVPCYNRTQSPYLVIFMFTAKSTSLQEFNTIAFISLCCSDNITLNREYILDAIHIKIPS